MQKLKDFFKKIASAVKSMIGEQSYSNTMNNAGKNADVYGIFSDFIKVLDKAADNFKQTEISEKNNTTNSDVRHSINPNFEDEFDKWDKEDTNVVFNVGNTSEPLKSIGIKNQQFQMRSGMILQKVNKHPEMTFDIFKEIPNLLENPIIVQFSDAIDMKTNKPKYDSRITVLGELYANMETNGKIQKKPVLVSIELMPMNSKKTSVLDVSIVTSAYGHTKLQEYLNNNSILYIDPNEKRTNKWLSLNRLQLPLGETKFGSIKKITYSDGKVKIENSKNASSMQIALEKAGIVDSFGNSIFNNDTNNSSNGKHSLKVDSNGNKLTEKQIEYFKDSKVRDENGNLLVVYHGTPIGGFTVFDSSKSTVENNPSVGNWFTPNFDLANTRYNINRNDAKNQNQMYTVYLNITNPLVIDANSNAWNQITLPKDLQGKSINKYYNPLISSYVDSNTASTENISKYAKQNGYDGVVIKNVRDGSVNDEPSDVYCTFNSNQSKNTDNLAPTTNPDIRFSKKVETEYNKAVSNNNMNTAQHLVEESAKEWGALTDDAGNPITLYHGTTNKFTVFDRQFGNSEGDWGKGFYFTNDENDVDKNYANEDGQDLKNKIYRYAEKIENENPDISSDEAYEMAKKKFVTSEPNTISAYLKISNPIKIAPNESGTYFDFVEEYDEDTDEYSEPTGLIVDFVEALNNQLDNFDYYGDINFWKFMPEYIYDGGMYVSDLVSYLKKQDELIDIYDNDNNSALNEIIRGALEEMGYDGIIDTSVSYKFTNMGLNSDTTHYIVFSSSQAKSADTVTYDDNGNVIPLSERFNSNNDDIRFSKKVDDFDAKDYNEVKLSNSEYGRLYHEAMTWDSDKPNRVLNRTLGGYKYYYILNDGEITIINKQKSINIHEEYKNADGNSKRFNKRPKNIGGNGRNNRSSANTVENGPTDRRNDRDVSGQVQGQGRSDGAGYAENGNNDNLREKERYSKVVDDDTRSLLKENENLKKMNDILEREMKTGHFFDDKAITNCAEELKRVYGSNIETDALTNQLRDMFEYVANDPESTYQTAMQMAKDIAADIVDESNAQMQIDSYAQDIKKTIRQAHISLDDSQKSELAYKYDTLKNARNESFAVDTIKNTSFS